MFDLTIPSSIIKLSPALVSTNNAAFTPIRPPRLSLPRPDDKMRPTMALGGGGGGGPIGKHGMCVTPAVTSLVS